MSQQFILNVIRDAMPLLVSSCCLFFSSVTARADNESGRMLNGSANDKAQIKQSVRLLPPAAEHHILNGNAGVRQYNGQVQSSPGTPVYPARLPAQVFYPKYEAPRQQQFTPLFDARTAAAATRAAAERARVVYTPKVVPKWNYTATPKNGVQTWGTGYQSSSSAQSRRNDVQPATSAALSSPSTSAALSRAQSAAALKAKSLSPDASWTGTGIRRLQSAPPAVAALSATPQLLNEEKRIKSSRSISWAEWYRRICRIIYQQWIVDPACAGKACVRVTVWSSRDIEARVLSFTPADGASRDAIKETSFRETSLRAINSLQKTETLDFPSSPARSKVIFDLDMNRSVNGPSGCVVAAFHDSGDLPGSASTTTSFGANNSSLSRSNARTKSKTKGGSVKVSNAAPSKANGDSNKSKQAVSTASKTSSKNDTGAKSKPWFWPNFHF